MISFKINNEDQLKTFSQKLSYVFNNKVRTNLKKSYETTGEYAVKEIQELIKSSLKIKKQGQLKTIKYKIYDAKQNKLPSLSFGTKYFLFNSFNNNTVIKSKKNMLAIPFQNFTKGKRIGQKEWKNFLNENIKKKKIFIKKTNNGYVILSNYFNKNLKEIKYKKKPNLIGYFFKSITIKRKFNFDKKREQIYSYFIKDFQNKNFNITEELFKK